MAQARASAYDTCHGNLYLLAIACRERSRSSPPVLSPAEQLLLKCLTGQVRWPTGAPKRCNNTSQTVAPAQASCAAIRSDLLQLVFASAVQIAPICWKAPINVQSIGVSMRSSGYSSRIRQWQSFRKEALEIDALTECTLSAARCSGL